MLQQAGPQPRLRPVLNCRPDGPVLTGHLFYVLQFYQRANVELGLYSQIILGCDEADVHYCGLDSFRLRVMLIYEDARAVCPTAAASNGVSFVWLLRGMWLVRFSSRCWWVFSVVCLVVC